MSDRYPYNKWQNNLIKLCLILVWRQGQLYTLHSTYFYFALLRARSVRRQLTCSDKLKSIGVLI